MTEESKGSRNGIRKQAMMTHWSWIRDCRMCVRSSRRRWVEDLRMEGRSSHSTRRTCRPLYRLPSERLSRWCHDCQGRCPPSSPGDDMNHTRPASLQHANQFNTNIISIWGLVV